MVEMEDDPEINENEGIIEMNEIKNNEENKDMMESQNKNDINISLDNNTKSIKKSDNKVKCYIKNNNPFAPIKGSTEECTIIIMFSLSLSLILLIISLCLSLKYIKEKFFFISIPLPRNKDTNPYFPFQMNYITMVILIAIILLSSFLTLLLIIGRGCVIKNKELYEVFFSQITRFLVFPILLNCILFLISSMIFDSYDAVDLSVTLPCIVISIISLASLSFIYFSTDIKGLNIFGFILKKCFITSLIYMNSYYIVYAIMQMVVEDYGMGSRHIRGMNIFFQLFWIIMTLIIVFFCKEIMFGICSIVTYSGVIAYKTSIIPGYWKDNKDDLGMGITFLTLSALGTVAVGLLYRKKIFS